jgi:hypothetical protein
VSNPRNGCTKATALPLVPAHVRNLERGEIALQKLFALAAARAVVGK